MDAEDRDRLVRIETKLDAALATDHDHETRLRSLEASHHEEAGRSRLVTFAASLLGGSVAASLINWFLPR